MDNQLDSQLVIIDQKRKKFLEEIIYRMNRQRSVMLIGEFGVGKTTLLNQIKAEHTVLKKIITIESLDPIESILADIINQVNQEGAVGTRTRVPRHLRKVRSLKNIGIMVDEAHELRRSTWPYFKRIMDSGIPILFAGMPELRDYIEERHGDIRSRLRVFELEEVAREEITSHICEKIPEEVLKYLLGFCDSNMRYFFEYLEDCKRMAKKMGKDQIDMEVAEKVV